jgi:hypothetical protein
MYLALSDTFPVHELDETEVFNMPCHMLETTKFHMLDM